jgi:uncharacterized protein (DUF1330 family)
MTAYAIAHMRHVTPGPWMIEYLGNIDATLAPFGGRFIVHDGEVEVVENDWPGHLIVIEFRTGSMCGTGIIRRPTRRSFGCASKIQTQT